MKHPEYKFHDFAGGSIDNRNIIIELSELHNKLSEWNGRQCFKTVHRYKQDFLEYWQNNKVPYKNGPKAGELHNSVSGYDGDCYADFLLIEIDSGDKKENPRITLPISLKTANEVIEKLQKEYEIKPEHLNYFYSGNRGIHLEVPIGLFGDIQPHKNFNQYLKAIAQRLVGQIKIDLSMYDKTRLYRVANTQYNTTGLYKIPLSYADIMLGSVDKIIGMAKQPREIDIIDDGNIIINEKLAKLFNKVKEEIDNRPQYERKEQKAEETIYPKEEKYCVWKIGQEGARSGNRNDAIVRQVSYYKQKGYTEEVVRSIVLDWNFRGQDPVLEGDVISRVADCYKANYDFGCNDNLLSSYCSQECGFYKRKTNKNTQSERPIINYKEIIKKISAGGIEIDITGSILDFPIKNIPQSGFIHDYIETFKDVTEAPIQFHVAGAVISLSAVIGRKIYMPYGINTLYPNLFILLGGVSGMPRKTTSVFPVKSILNRINENYCLSDWFSLEAIYEELIEFPQKVLIASEFRSLMELTKKEYGKALIPLLTDLYDNKDGIKFNFKSQKGIKYIHNAYLSLLAATTVEWMQIQVNDVKGGFFARFLPILGGTPDYLIAIPPEIESYKWDHLVEELKIIQSLEGRINLSSEARQYFEQVYVELRENHEKDFYRSYLDGFQSRIGTNILKLALIFEVSKTKAVKEISLKSVEDATICMQYFQKTYKKLVLTEIIDDASRKRMKAVLKILVEAWNKNPGQPIRKSDVAGYFHMEGKIYNAILNDLVEMGLVILEKINGKSHIIFTDQLFTGVC